MSGKWRKKMGKVMKDLKSMKGWKEELRQMKEEVRERVREYGRL